MKRILILILTFLFIGENMADDFSYEIVKTYGTISNGKGGWSMELNSVSWSGREPKFDIRSWSADHQKMGKGVTLTKEELQSLKNLLNSIDIQ
jgi:hypothetical protein